MIKTEDINIVFKEMIEYKITYNEQDFYICNEDNVWYVDYRDDDLDMEIIEDGVYSVFSENNNCFMLSNGYILTKEEFESLKKITTK